MDEIFSKIEKLKAQALKSGNDQIESLFTNVQSPALKNVLNKIKSKKGYKNPSDVMKDLAGDQVDRIEKAANNWIKRINEVKQQGQKRFEEEVAEVLAGSILGSATQVKRTIKTSRKRVVEGVDSVTRFALDEVDRVTAPLKGRKKKKKSKKKAKSKTKKSAKKPLSKTSKKKTKKKVSSKKKTKKKKKA